MNKNRLWYQVPGHETGQWYRELYTGTDELAFLLQRPGISDARAILVANGPPWVGREGESPPPHARRVLLPPRCVCGHSVNTHTPLCGTCWCGAFWLAMEDEGC